MYVREREEKEKRKREREKYLNYFPFFCLSHSFLLISSFYTFSRKNSLDMIHMIQNPVEYIRYEYVLYCTMYMYM